MPFWIQTGNPSVVPSPTISPESDLAETVQAVFPMETEDAVIVWNHIRVPLSYKYDVSVVMEDVVGLSEFLLGSSKSTRVSFGSDTFQAIWRIERLDRHIRVDSEWASVAGDIENVLNERRSLEIPTADFLAEWNELTRKVLECCSLAGVQVVGSAALERLQGIAKAIPCRGRLYRAK